MHTHNIGYRHHSKRRKQLSARAKTSFGEAFVNKAVYFFAIFGNAFTIPQLAKIWVEHNAQGLSLPTWGAYFVSAIFWLGYGIYHKEKVIIISNALSMIVNLVVVVGILVFAETQI